MPTGKNTLRRELVWKKVLTERYTIVHVQSTTVIYSGTAIDVYYWIALLRTIKVMLVEIPFTCRYCQPPAKLWEWMEPYLEDEEVGEILEI